jgi:hypothetical protein
MMLLLTIWFLVSVANLVSTLDASAMISCLFIVLARFRPMLCMISAKKLSILKVLVSSHLFTFDEKNKVLREVKLGDYKALDRPKPVNPKNICIPGKAMAVALHLRLMPYFLWRLLTGNVVHNDAIDLLVILARLLEYIMADKLNHG